MDWSYTGSVFVGLLCDWLVAGVSEMIEFIIIAWLWVTVYVLAAWGWSQSEGIKHIDDITLKQHLVIIVCSPFVIVPIVTYALIKRIFNV